jgi:hypothetical protein
MDSSAFAGRSLLTTLNTVVTALNREILGRLPGQLRAYRAVDTVETDNNGAAELHEVPVEYL